MLDEDLDPPALLVVEANDIPTIQDMQPRDAMSWCSARLRAFAARAVRCTFWVEHALTFSLHELISQNCFAKINLFMFLLFRKCFFIFLFFDSFCNVLRSTVQCSMCVCVCLCVVCVFVCSLCVCGVYLVVWCACLVFVSVWCVCVCFCLFLR